MRWPGRLSKSRFSRPGALRRSARLCGFLAPHKTGTLGASSSVGFRPKTDIIRASSARNTGVIIAQYGLIMRQPYNVLFLCTGNSARSILAEALMNRMGKGHFKAFSAGSFPKGEVHPAALRLLADLQFDSEALRSKSWDEFAVPGAPEMDFIFTVCDNAAGETCPIWPGHPMTAHWGIEDPAAVEGSEQKIAFHRALALLRQRISLFMALPMRDLDDMALQTRLRAIGRDTEGATRPTPSATEASGTR